MTTQNQTPTPRTDALSDEMIDAGELTEQAAFFLGFARQFERESNARLAGCRRRDAMMCASWRENARQAAQLAAMRAALADFVDYVNPGDDTSLAAMLDEARALIAPKCSVCRRRHGQEVQHPCE